MRLFFVTALVLLAGCGASVETPAPMRARKPFTKAIRPHRPAAGVKEVDCVPPSHVCRREMPNACERACSEGDAGACVVLARYFMGKPADEEETALRDQKRAPELYRLACRAGDPWGCNGLVDVAKPEATDLALAEEKLGPACKQDAICGCFLYGDALTRDKKREVEGIAILDEVCVRGGLSACDMVDLIAEICARDGTAEGMCKDLREQGRVRPWQE